MATTKLAMWSMFRESGICRNLQNARNQFVSTQTTTWFDITEFIAITITIRWSGKRDEKERKTNKDLLCSLSAKRRCIEMDSEWSMGSFVLFAVEGTGRSEDRNWWLSESEMCILPAIKWIFDQMRIAKMWWFIPCFMRSVWWRTHWEWKWHFVSSPSFHFAVSRKRRDSRSDSVLYDVENEQNQHRNGRCFPYFERPSVSE